MDRAGGVVEFPQRENLAIILLTCQLQGTAVAEVDVLRVCPITRPELLEVRVH